MFHDDQQMGFGMIQFRNGDKYIGNVEKGTPNGNGTMKYNNGDIYIGKIQ